MGMDSLDNQSASLLEGIALEKIKRAKAQKSVLYLTEAFTPDYTIGWFHKELGETLDAFVEAVEKKLKPRLIIEVPPRTGKSQLVSRCFPPFLLGKHPEWEVICATYGQDLADDMGRYVRTVMNDPQYKDLFPKTLLDPQSNAADRIGTLSRGGYKSVGVGSALTGRGAHVMIIDDPVKDREDADSERSRQRTWDWYSSTCRTRIAPGGGIIVLMTRWHEDDLAGRLQERARENPKAEQWHVLKYPAIAVEDEKHRKKGAALHPERYDEDELNMIRHSIMPRDWSALYQQNPTPDEGLYYNAESIHKALYKPEDLPTHMHYYMSADLAISERTEADYTCIWPFGVDHKGVIWFLPSIYHGRIGSLDMVEKIIDLAADKNHRVMKACIEKGQISLAIGPLLSKRMQERGEFFSIETPVPKQDKIARSRSFQGRLEQGMIKIPDTPFIHETVIPELLSFPAGKHDDINDTMVWASLMLETLVGARPAAPLPSNAPAPGSFADMRARARGRRSADSNERGRAPKRLNGKDR